MPKQCGNKNMVSQFEETYSSDDNDDSTPYSRFEDAEDADAQDTDQLILDKLLNEIVEETSKTLYPGQTTIIPPPPLPSTEEMYREFCLFLEEEKQNLASAKRLEEETEAKRQALIIIHQKEKEAAEKQAAIASYEYTSSLRRWHRITHPLIPRPIKTLPRLNYIEIEKDHKQHLKIHVSLFDELKEMADKIMKKLKLKLNYKPKARKPKPIINPTTVRGSLFYKRNRCFERKTAPLETDDKGEIKLSEKEQEKIKKKQQWEAENARLQAERAQNPNYGLVQQNFDTNPNPRGYKPSQFGVPPTISVSYQEILDLPTEEGETEEDEQLLEEELLKSICEKSILAVENLEKKEATDSKEAEEQKIADAEEAEYLATMAKYSGLTVSTSPKTAAKPDRKQSKSEKNEKALKKAGIKLGLVGLIQQKKDERCGVDSKYSARTAAFADLADKNKLEKVLTFTKLCKSVTGGTKCTHKNCRFAHSLDQLQHRECRFGENCSFVKFDDNGNYANASFGRTGKKCNCYHPGETTEMFSKRLNIKFTPPKPPATSTVPTSTILTSTAPTSNSVSVTKPWSDIVRVLTEDDKKVMYSTGYTIVSQLGVPDNAQNPIDISKSARLPGNTRGLGFSESKSTSTSTSTSTPTPTLTAWVKGTTLQSEIPPPSPTPPARVRKSRWDDKSQVDKVYIDEALDKAKEKAAYIKEVLDKAKEKVAVIQYQIEETETKIDTSITSDTTIFRVPKDKAATALMSIIRSGISNFKLIEY